MPTSFTSLKIEFVTSYYKMYLWLVFNVVEASQHISMTT